jgi:hypothetical protein
MKCGKWIGGTAALALGLSAGAFAQDHPRYDGRDGDAARYTQRDNRDRAPAWNNDYRADGDRYSYRDGDRDRHDRDHRMRDRDHHDRDHARRDRDDRGRDRD